MPSLRPHHALAALLLLLAAPLTAQTPQERLWDAAIAGDTAAIRQALTDGAAVDSLDTRTSRNGRRALNWAALNDRVPAIQVLLAGGATLDAENLTGFTPLHHAAEAGSLNAARELLIAGADPKHLNARGVLPADTARRNGFEDVALLIEAAARGERPTRP